MKNKNIIRGMHNLKTACKTQKSAIPEKQGSDHIHLYMLEKEETRLLNEQSRLLLRLEAIRDRLNVIENFRKEKTMPYQKNKQDYQEQTEFKTMSINY